MTGVVSRADWTAESFSKDDKKITIETHTVFGWKVQRHIMPAGTKMVTVAKNEVPRNQAPNRAMYVKGRATVEIEGGSAPDRVPGLYTQERPAQPAGKSIVTAVEDTEFWCFNYTMNRNSLPALTPIRLNPGESYTLPQNSLLFAMQGEASSIVGPSTYAVQAVDTVITATEPFYAFIIAEAK